MNGPDPVPCKGNRGRNPSASRSKPSPAASRFYCRPEVSSAAELPGGRGICARIVRRLPGPFHKSGLSDSRFREGGLARRFGYGLIQFRSLQNRTTRDDIKRLMRLKTIGLATLLLLFQARQAAPEPIQVYLFGMSKVSCATWLYDPNMAQRGEDWLLGVWSGMNVTNEKNHLVGKHTDTLGVIGEVKAFCAAHPSEELSSATLQTYTKLEAAGR